jgi:hypothetical protein
MTDQNLAHFLTYLEHCGGEDRHEFVDASGHPDTDGARVFAEELRDRFGEHVGEYLNIEQRVNVVRITAHAHTAVI